MAQLDRNPFNNATELKV